MTTNLHIAKVVRKDFDPKKEYSVDVSNCTEDEKKKVQQAFFDVGFVWESSGKEYLHLDAVQYSNVTAKGFLSKCCKYGTTIEGCNMPAREFLDLVYEPADKGHIHAELMQQYAEDAKTHAEPWKLWQVNYGVNFGEDKWVNLRDNPKWGTGVTYRRKPKTHFVHGVEIPDLRVTPKQGDLYWCPMPHLQWQVSHFERGDSSLYTYKEENGLCYEYTEEGKQAAILHAKAMLGIISN